MIFQINVCEMCGHGWMGKELPERCPKCHKRTWNGKKVTSGEVGAVKDFPAIEEPVYPEDWPKGASELIAETEFSEPVLEAARAEVMPKARRGKAGVETLTGSLCRHGLYAANCARCA